MRKYALLENNLVNNIITVSQEEIALISQTKMVVDIEDMLPQPEIGWVLSGNKLVHSEYVNNTDFDLFQQTSQRKFGEKILIEAVDKIDPQKRIIKLKTLNDKCY